jgi:hypothetical protein
LLIPVPAILRRRNIPHPACGYCCGAAAVLLKTRNATRAAPERQLKMA